MNKTGIQCKWRKQYGDVVSIIFFILFARSVFMLNNSPEYLVDGDRFIFIAKPGMIALLWTIAILCGMLVPLMIHTLMESIKGKERFASNIFQVLISLTIIGILSVSVYSIHTLKQIRVTVAPESFSYKSNEYDISLTWDIENISAHYVPWYRTGEYTDEYPWIDLSTAAYSIHVPLRYIGGVDKLIDQSYLYWKDNNS